MTEFARLETPLGISVKGLGHVYPNGTKALDGIDLEIQPGLFGLLGPNGAGKSTLMRVLCTLLVPTSGRALVAGYDVVRERRTVRGFLGYLPQEFGGWRLHRVREVLDTLARLSGIRDRQARQRRVEEVLAEVGLDDVGDRKVKALSGGMVRRLGVAQALVHDPPVLVVDEPTVGLDPQERIRFRDLMGKLSRSRVIVLSTHIVSDLGTACRDLALIDGGRLVFRGGPDGLVRQAKGRVFDAVIPVDGESRLGPGVELVSRRPEGVGLRVRGVSSTGALPAGAEAVAEPTLEEAYLAFMTARGRSVDEIAEASR